MATEEQVRQFRDANEALTARVRADLERFWGFVDLSRPAAAEAALLNFVPLLTQQYGEMAATIAADWYEMLRGEAVEAGLVAAVRGATSFRAVAADPVSAAVSREAVSSALLLLQGDNPSPPARVLTAIQDTTSRHVLQAGRDTITQNAGRDPAARGWQRFVRSGGCDFCRMLSSRGGVYTDRTSRFAAHDHCNCAAAPTWDRSAPKVDVAAEYVASAKTAGMTPRAREVYRERTRKLLKEAPPEGSTFDEGVI